jgi:hypothetical protein
MTILRHILAVDNDGLVCIDCVIALGGHPKTPEGSVQGANRVCGHCGQIKLCIPVDAMDWPATLIRPDAPRSAPEAPRTALPVLSCEGGAQDENASHEPNLATQDASGGEGDECECARCQGGR